MKTLQLNWQNDLKKEGIELSDEQMSQFRTYFRTLIEWNEKMNLTAIVEEDQVYYKHFFDSLSLSFFVSLDGPKKLADVGSGAGFPGIPLAILFPDLQVVIIDSLNKRIRFLEHLVQEIGCSNVRCIHSRAEDAGQNQELREKFDIVTARAVARLRVLNEYCLPLVKVGGIFAAMKASEADAEISEAKESLKQLGGKLKQTYQFELPFEQAFREIILIDKVKATPKKYPRKPGLPAKQPL